MTVEPTSIPSLASKPTGISQARREGIQAASHAARTAGQHAQLALLVGGLWLLLALAVNAAGEGALGICFAGLAALWISMAAIENRGTRVPSATQTMRAQIRLQAASSGS